VALRIVPAAEHGGLRLTDVPDFSDDRRDEAPPDPRPTRWVANAATAKWAGLTAVAARVVSGGSYQQLHVPILKLRPPMLPSAGFSFGRGPSREAACCLREPCTLSLRV